VFWSSTVEDQVLRSSFDIQGASAGGATRWPPQQPQWRDSCKFHEAGLACDRLDCEAWYEDQEEFSQCPGTAHWKQKKDMGAAGGNRKAGQHLRKPHTDFNNMLKKAKIKPTTEKVTRKRGAGV